MKCTVLKGQYYLQMLFNVDLSHLRKLNRAATPANK